MFLLWFGLFLTFGFQNQEGSHYHVLLASAFNGFIYDKIGRTPNSQESNPLTVAGQQVSTQKFEMQEGV